MSSVPTNDWAHRGFPSAPLIGRAVSLIALTGDAGLSAPDQGLDSARKTIIITGAHCTDRFGKYCKAIFELNRPFGPT